MEKEKERMEMPLFNLCSGACAHLDGDNFTKLNVVDDFDRPLIVWLWFI
jgi:hypothetical protein